MRLELSLSSSTCLTHINRHFDPPLFWLLPGRSEKPVRRWPCRGSCTLHQSHWRRSRSSPRWGWSWSWWRSDLQAGVWQEDMCVRSLVSSVRLWRVWWCATRCTVTLQPFQCGLCLNVDTAALAQVAGDDGPVPLVVVDRRSVKLSVCGTDQNSWTSDIPWQLRKLSFYQGRHNTALHVFSTPR